MNALEVDEQKDEEIKQMAAYNDLMNDFAIYDELEAQKGHSKILISEISDDFWTLFSFIIYTISY